MARAWNGTQLAPLPTGDTPDRDDCVHHWLIGEPGRSMSGSCKKCGAERTFAGGIADYGDLRHATNYDLIGRGLSHAPDRASLVDADFEVDL